MTHSSAADALIIAALRAENLQLTADNRKLRSAAAVMMTATEAFYAKQRDQLIDDVLTHSTAATELRKDIAANQVIIGAHKATLDAVRLELNAAHMRENELISQMLRMGYSYIFG